MSETVYWASKPTEEIVDAIRPRIEAYYEWLHTSDRLSMWARVHRQYYAGHFDGGQLSTDGEQDELISVNVNDFRNLVQHLIVMSTSQRPHFSPRAVNSDHRSQTQTILSEGILDFVMIEKGLEEALDEAIESALLFEDGWVHVDWDANAGQDYAVADEPEEPGAPPSFVKTGDVVFRVYAPIDMVVDFTKTRQDDHRWFCSRRFVNRWDLAAQYPEYAERIAGMGASHEGKRTRFANRSYAIDRYDSDDIELFEFIHDRTPALPDGRKVTFLLDAGSDMPPLFDGPIPYKDLSLYRMTPAKMLGTSHGYSPALDLLSLQSATNALWTTLASNVSAFGVQNLWTMLGDNIEVSSVGGLKLMQSRQKPEGLNLVANSPDTYKLLELVSRAMETISGVNSVARGNPEASLKSGAALALVQSQALQFAIGLQKRYVRFCEGVATGVIKIYQQFAKAPQVAHLTGKANKGFLQEFTASDLDRISRVVVDLGSPLQRTIAGRVEIATMLGDKGMLKTPEEYIQVLTTGRIEPVLEATQKEMLAIKAENERLADGTTMSGDGLPTVVVCMTDNHPAHIREHAAVISSPDSRDAPQVVAQALDHIQEHVNVWQSMPPALAMALQIPPPPGLMPAGPPGSTGGPPAPPQEEPIPPEATPEALAPPGEQAGPQMPLMPINPVTGERAQGPQALGAP